MIEKYHSDLFESNLTPFERLCRVLEILRSPEGCGWDRKQTHQSLLPYLIEETYEVAETIERGDSAELKEELGDLLCQIVFHAQIAAEEGRFGINDSVEDITGKLIRRHPHVFEQNRDLNPDEVNNQWEKQKIASGEKDSVLSGLPQSMPALMMAFRLGEKASGVGFDWKRPKDVIEKLEEELEEVKQEITSDDRQRISDEIGDLLFATASLARKLDIDPEFALKRALTKFMERFSRLENSVRKNGGSFDDYNLEQLEEIWQSIK